MYNETCDECNSPNHEYLIDGICSTCAVKAIEDRDKCKAALKVIAEHDTHTIYGPGNAGVMAKLATKALENSHE